jgi:hypothetical protein
VDGAKTYAVAFALVAILANPGSRTDSDEGLPLRNDMRLVINDYAKSLQRTPSDDDVQLVAGEDQGGWNGTRFAIPQPIIDGAKDLLDEFPVVADQAAQPKRKRKKTGQA